MSTTANQDPYQDQQINVGTDYRLMLNQVGPLDPEYWSEEDSQFLPKSSMAIRNYVLATKDVMASNNGTVNVPFNSLTTFKFGNEGLPNVLGAEMHIKLPQLGDSGAANAHPLAAGYAGAGTMLRYVPYVAERYICGSQQEPLRFRFLNETLRAYTSEGLHIKRALCMDTEGTQKRAAYNNSVGAIPDEATTSLRYRLLIWLPHCSDSLDKNQLLPVQAFATEFTCQYRAPPLLGLVQSDVAHANIVTQPTTTTTPEVFIRLLYVVTEKAERGTFSNLVLSKKGLTYQTLQIGREQPLLVTGNAASTNNVIQLKGSVNPCAFMAWGVRYYDDTKEVGQTADHQDTNPVLRAVANVIRRPNWTNWQPWDAFALYDGGQRVTDKRGQDDMQNSLLQGHTCYFPGDFSTNIGWCVFTMYPTIENHGLGHITLNSMNNPRLLIDLPAMLSTENASATAQRQIDLFYFERNKTFLSNGGIVRLFAVSD